MRSLAIISLLLTGSAAAQTPGFWLMGTPPGLSRSYSYALSQDGGVAAGYSTGSGSDAPGFRWTAGGGRQDFLGPGMPLQSPAKGLSTDGNTLVGYMAGGTGPHRAYRRVGAGPLQELAPVGYQKSYASAVSGNGDVVVGHNESTVGGIPLGQAFRWTPQGGMQNLGWLHGSGISQARAISRDGGTIVGDSYAGATEAFVWREGTGMQGLPPLPGASPLGSYARGVNADGSVIVGEGYDSGGNIRAVRWAGGAAQDLGVLPGYLVVEAFGVSDDGLVVAGPARGIGVPDVAFVWTPSTGMLSLPSYLSQYGVSLPLGWSSRYIYAVSGDGMTFAGDAVNASGAIQGFVASVPTPAGAVVLIGPVVLLSRRRRAAT